MLSSSKLDITPFSISARVTRTDHKHGKIKVIEVNCYIAALRKRTTIRKPDILDI